MPVMLFHLPKWTPEAPQPICSKILWYLSAPRYFDSESVLIITPVYTITLVRSHAKRSSQSTRLQVLVDSINSSHGKKKVLVLPIQETYTFSESFCVDSVGIRSALYIGKERSSDGNRRVDVIVISDVIV